MSMKLLINVVEQCKRKPSEKLMLIVLSNFANQKAECFPSFETLARLCNISTRQAQNIIYTLIKEGEIAVSRQKGGVNFYSILNYHTAITREPAYAGTPTKFSATNEISGGDNQPVQPPTHEIDFVPPTKFLSPTHETHFVTPTKPTSSEPVIKPIEPPREPVKANYVVAPVGDNTTHTPSSSVSDNPTVTEQIGTPPTAETQPTGTIASPIVNDPPKAQVPNPETSTTIEGDATSLDLATVSNTEAHATQPPPVVPPREETVTRKRAKPVSEEKSQTDEKVPRTYSDQQKMVGAICKVFGWDMSKLTRNNRGLVGKVARDLLEATATPADVQGLYDFCKAQNWSGAFTPSALSSQWANYYALKHKSGTTADYIENEAGMIFHRYVPDPNRPPMFNYNRPLVTITEEELATGPQTLEECKAEFERVTAELTDKMTLKPDEVDLDAIPEDEELRAILW